MSSKCVEDRNKYNCTACILLGLKWERRAKCPLHFARILCVNSWSITQVHPFLQPIFIRQKLCKFPLWESRKRNYIWFKNLYPFPLQEITGWSCVKFVPSSKVTFPVESFSEWNDESEICLRILVFSLWKVWNMMTILWNQSLVTKLGFVFLRTCTYPGQFVYLSIDCSW